MAFGRNGEDFQTVPLLETLDISYNQVTQLSDEAFVSFFFNFKLLKYLKSLLQGYNFLYLCRHNFFNYFSINIQIIHFKMYFVDKEGYFVILF